MEQFGHKITTYFVMPKSLREKWHQPANSK